MNELLKELSKDEIKYELATAYVDKLYDRLLAEKDSGHFVAGYLGSMLARHAVSNEELMADLEDMATFDE
jgi:hypothetical protein